MAYDSSKRPSQETIKKIQASIAKFRKSSEFFKDGVDDQTKASAKRAWLKTSVTLACEADRMEQQIAKWL